MYVTCFVVPKFGWHWTYLERLPKSRYIGHSFAVPKAARCVALDQNMRVAMTFSRLQVGLLVGAHWTLLCSSQKISESYISENTCSLPVPSGHVQYILKGVKWNIDDNGLLNDSLIKVVSLQKYKPGIIKRCGVVSLLPDGMLIWMSIY